MGLKTLHLPKKNQNQISGVFSANQMFNKKLMLTKNYFKSKK